MTIAARAVRLAGRARAAADRFAFAPASAAPLAVLRVGLGVVLLAQAVTIAPGYLELYEGARLLGGPLRGAEQGGFPCVEWLANALAPAGVGEAGALLGAGVVYLIALVALIVGFGTRAAAVVAWITHFMLMTSASQCAYGVDELANVFLFYLAWVPSASALSLDACLRRVSTRPSSATRLATRVVQIHLCLVYLASGLAKARGTQWWNGDAIWRSLMLPEYRQHDFSFLAAHPWLARAGGWWVLLVEVGYAICIWPRLTRRIWIAAVVTLHVGIAMFMGLRSFGAIMMVFTIAAFGVPAEPTAARTAVASRWAALLLFVLGALALCVELQSTTLARRRRTAIPRRSTASARPNAGNLPILHEILARPRTREHRRAIRAPLPGIWERLQDVRAPCSRDPGAAPGNLGASAGCPGVAPGHPGAFAGWPIAAPRQPRAPAG